MEVQAAAWIAAFSYPAVFLLLVACGLGAPLSEDLILVTGGLVAAHGHALLGGMMVAGWLGTVCGDFLLYRVGRTLGGRLLVHPRMQKLLPPSRVAWVRAHLERRGALTVFAVRFLPGFRVPTYLLSGAGGLPARRFLLADALGAAISAPLLVFLGFRFGRDVLGQVQRGFRWVLLAVAVAATLLLLRQALRRWRRVASVEG